MQKVHRTPKMKYSAFLSPDTRKLKSSRNSEIDLARSSATYLFEKGQSSA